MSQVPQQKYVDIGNRIAAMFLPENAPRRTQLAEKIAVELQTASAEGWRACEQHRSGAKS